MARPKHILWILQAESDLRSVEGLIETGNASQACFYAQQTAERAIKALAYFRGAEMVKSYSLAAICVDMNINGELANHAVKLDFYYLSARYPDALPDDGIPFERLNLTLAREALVMAREFLRRAKEEMNA